MPLKPESYSLVAYEAERRGLTFWELVAEALTEYLGTNIEAQSPEEVKQAKLKAQADLERKILRLLKQGPKTVSALSEALAPLSRPTITSRLKDMEARGMVAKHPKGTIFGKKVYEWSIPEASLEDKIEDFMKIHGVDRVILTSSSRLYKFTGMSREQIVEALKGSTRFKIYSPRGIPIIIPNG